MKQLAMEARPAAGIAAVGIIVYWKLSETEYMPIIPVVVLALPY